MQHIVAQFGRSRSQAAAERPSLNLQRHTKNPLAREFDLEEGSRVFSEASVTTICGNGRDIALDGVPGIGSLCNPRAICMYAPDEPPHSPTDTFHILVAESTGLRVASRSMLRTLKTLTGKGMSTSSFSVAGVVQVPLGVLFTDDTHHKLKLLRRHPGGDKVSGPYDSLLDKTFYTDQGKDKRAVPGTHSLITLSGSVAGHADGLITKALFNRPTGLASACSGRIVLICDTGNNCIRCLDLQNHFVTTLVGTPGRNKSDYMTRRQNNPLDPYIRANIPIDKACLRKPMGICVSSTKPGIVFIADTGNHTVKKIDTLNQTVQNIAGLEGQPGSAIGYESMLDTPTGICELPDRTLLVADKIGLHRVCPDRCFLWQVSSTRKTQGWRDGPLNKALFSSPNALAFDGTRVFVCDRGNQNVRMITFGHQAAQNEARAFGSLATDADQQDVSHEDNDLQGRSDMPIRPANAMLQDTRNLPVDRTDEYGREISYQNGARTYDDNDTIEISGCPTSYRKERAIPSSVNFTVAGNISHMRQRRKSLTPDFGYLEHPTREPHPKMQQEDSDSTEMVERYIVNPQDNSTKKAYPSPKALDARAQSLQSRIGYNFKTIQRADSADIRGPESHTADSMDSPHDAGNIFSIARMEVHRDADAFLRGAALEANSQVVKSVSRTKDAEAGGILAEQTAVSKIRGSPSHREISISTKPRQAPDTAEDEICAELYADMCTDNSTTLGTSVSTATTRPSMSRGRDSLIEAEEEYNLYKSLSSDRPGVARSVHSERSLRAKSVDTPMVVLSSTAKKTGEAVSAKNSKRLIRSAQREPTNHKIVNVGRKQMLMDQESSYSEAESEHREAVKDIPRRRERHTEARPPSTKLSGTQTTVSSGWFQHSCLPRNINDMLANKFQEKHKNLINALVRCSHAHIPLIASHMPREAEEITVQDFYWLLISRCISARTILLIARISDSNQLCSAGFDSLGRQALSLNEFRNYNEDRRSRRSTGNTSLSMNAVMSFSVYGDTTDLRVKSVRVCGVKVKPGGKSEALLNQTLTQFPDLIDKLVWQSTVSLSQLIDSAEVDDEENTGHITLICPVEITLISQQTQGSMSVTTSLLLTTGQLTLRHTADDFMKKVHVLLRTQGIYPIAL